jgi:hypothetical protein
LNINLDNLEVIAQFVVLCCILQKRFSSVNMFHCVNLVHFINSIAFYWSLWPHGLKCRPWSLRHWDSRFESHLWHGWLSLSIHHHSLVTLSSTVYSLVTEKASQNKPPSLNKSVSSPTPHVIIQSHVIFPEIQELMLSTISTTRAAKQDHVARGQHHSSKVMSDCYNTEPIHTKYSKTDC